MFAPLKGCTVVCDVDYLHIANRSVPQACITLWHSFNRIKITKPNTSLIISDECTICCKPSGNVTGTSEGVPTDDGYIKQYVKCLQLPNATTHVTLTFITLKLSDSKRIRSLDDDCRNLAEVLHLNHLRIENGPDDSDPFTCSDALLSKPDTWHEKNILSPDNKLIFKLLAGRPPADGDPWYDVHYTCKLQWNGGIAYQNCKCIIVCKFHIP